MYIEIDKIHRYIVTVELLPDKISDSDIERLVDILDDVHDKHNKTGIMLLIPSFNNLQIRILYRALKVFVDNRKQISKIAIIGDSVILEAGIRFENIITPWNEKYFNADDLTDAWRWLTEE